MHNIVSLAKVNHLLSSPASCEQGLQLVPGRTSCAVDGAEVLVPIRGALSVYRRNGECGTGLSRIAKSVGGTSVPPDGSQSTDLFVVLLKNDDNRA